MSEKVNKFHRGSWSVAKCHTKGKSEREMSQFTIK